MTYPKSRMALAIAGALYFCSIQKIQAQNLPSLEPVLVHSSKLTSEHRMLQSSKTIIPSEEIARKKQATLVDLLQGQVGIEIARHGGSGSVSSIFMRGQASNNVAIFVNEVRWITDAYGGVVIPDIPPEEIEKIVILRGNWSAVYGEAAIGGVIQIYTKKPILNQSAPYFSALYGSRNTSDLAFGYRSQSEDITWSGSVTRYETDGFSSLDPAESSSVNPDKDRFQRTTFLLNSEKLLTPTAKLGVQMTLMNNLVAYDSLYDTAETTHHSRNRDVHFSGYLEGNVYPEWHSKLILNFGRTRLDDYKNGHAISGNEGTIKNYLWQHRYQLDESTISLLLEHKKEDFNFLEFASNQYSRTTNAYGLGYQVQWDNLGLQTQVRHDRIRTEDLTLQQNTWRTALDYWITEDSQFSASYATAFRAPSASELFGDIWGTQGNRSLKPEHHKGYDLSFSTSNFLGQISATYFVTNTENAIEYAQNTFKNIAQTENKGVELELLGDVQGWHYQLNWVTQNPVNTNNQQRLARRAKQYGTIEVRTKVAQIEWAGQMILSGNRIDNGVTLPSYTLMHLSASAPIAKDWLARVKLENVINESYQLVQGYQTAPRGIFFTLQFTP